MPVLPALLFTGVALVAAAAPVPPNEQGRRSLEDLLREAELERARRLEELAPRVVELVGTLDELRAPVRTSVSDARQRDLAELGPEASPLLVPHLDPGADAGRAQVFRSELVAEVLAGFRTATVTDALLDLARTGTAIGRANALEVLASTPEPDRVVDAIVAIARGDSDLGVPTEQLGYVHEAAYSTLARLGNERASEFVRRTLLGSDVDRARAALAALEATPAESSAETVLAALESDVAPKLAGAIATYYRAHESLLEDLDHSDLVGAVAVDETIGVDDRIALFDLLRVTDARVGTPVKRKLDDYTEYARSDVRRAALMLLARMGDRGARRELLAEFDDRIETRPSSIDAYTDRATMLHEIGQFDDAVRDWREVIDILKENPTRRRRAEPFVGVARSLARLKRYREARDYLKVAPVSLQELQELGRQRDFAEMAESRYGDIFRDDG